jgi:hypothetical protein
MFEDLSSGFVVGTLDIVPSNGSHSTLGGPEFEVASERAGLRDPAYLVAWFPRCYLRVWLDSTTPAETLAIPSHTVDDFDLRGRQPVMFAKNAAAARLDRWLG